MKEHGSGEQAGEIPARALKSLLKKPGQTKPKSQKNRVVINEKLNEFFAADYIILIKEECCADYEEECDCCCQEHEMIRLGNCKECRAELNLHFDGGGGRFGERDGDADCEVGGGGHEQVLGGEESLDEDDEGEEDEEEEEVGTREEKGTGATSPRNHQQRQTHQQQETLSPPEGYKDVCEESEASGEAEQRHSQPVCAECNYYHRQAAETGEQGGVDGSAEEFKASQEASQSATEKVEQETSDQAQQTTPDLQQRYLVETVTMTTVTERRIVREISTENGAPGLDEADGSSGRSLEALRNDMLLGPSDTPEAKEESSVRFDDSAKSDGAANGGRAPASNGRNDQSGRETPDATELSLTFKLGSASLVSNSLKPNSAVRQLFPDPRFISPPPAPAKGVVSLSAADDAQDANAEAQKFLITTESLRLFDAVKRSKLTGVPSDAESESSTIKKTIERNALRRSLICKYDSTAKKKNNLRSKDLTLEERIRQLTCVDLDDQDTESSASENATTGDGSDYTEFPVRTSPSGEESTVGEPPCRVPPSTSSLQDHNSTPAPPVSAAHHSTYRKITDLFVQKKDTIVESTTKSNMPDLGIGNKLTQGKEYPVKTPVSKMNSDARKQFLASLAPLSCVAGTGIDSREDYYQLSSKITTSGNRDSISYNSDSSYSLEDIEAALRGEERNCKNGGGPPDVTRGTPTSTGPDDDSTTDELLAFVEQDKSRTERIKRRYDTEDHHHHHHHHHDDDDNNDDDDDDELNDYGFNRRPSVRGIKPQFGSTNEIIRQLQSRGAVPNSLPELTKAGSHVSWPYYDNESDKQRSFNEEDDDAYQTINDGRDTHTINRINTMQKQIDDIYQTIAETAVSVQGTLKRGSYLESTLPRTLARVPVADGECHRYPDPKNGVRFPEQPHAAGARMLRIAGGGDVGAVPGGVYNTLPAKGRRRQTAVAISNYPCSLVPASDTTKCYRTMYLVPYNGISDPTYQNIQRILPPHSSANYATHVERYPYPVSRTGGPEQPQQPPLRYYARPAQQPPPLHAQSALHLHLHQPVDEFRVPGTLPFHGMHPLQLHQHHQQTLPYGSVPYSVTTPLRGAVPGGGYSYQVHLGRAASDVQTQTVSLQPQTLTTSSPLSTYNSIAQLSTVSSTTSVLASPTKLQQQRVNSCIAAERGVPEGAASAPSHDFSSNSSSSSSSIHVATSSFLGNASNVPPPNTQNSVYYAMNV